MKTLRIAILVLCTSSFAFCADAEFKAIVHSIEHTYGVHHVHIPFLGLAMFFARPSGVRGFKLAVFEGFHATADSEEVSRVVEQSLGPGWYPIVRVLTKGQTDGETTLIYTNPNGNGMRMMIVNLEPSEAVVLKMDLTEHAIEEWLKEPGEKVDHHVERQHHEDDDRAVLAKK
jgi:hypothetical protein